MKTLRAVLPVSSLLVILACGGTPPPLPDTVPMIGRPTPKPGTLTNPRDPAQRGAALAYGDSLQWAEDATHRFHGQFDRNLLDTLGTRGTVTPEIGMHRMRPEQLDSGRIQLRVNILPGAGYLAGYPAGRYGRLSPSGEYRLPPGKSYVWVDSLTLYAPPHGDTIGIAKIVVIPADTAFVIDTATVQLFGRTPFNQAVARWSPAVCWDCMRQSWCALN